LTPADFIAKWRNATLKERSGAQEHFIDLCRMLDEPTPAEVDSAGSWYCFERGAKKAGGGEGWADVWKRGCFGWEYKGKGRDLQAAFKQLQLYAPALEYPPLLVVCDLDSIIIHTAFTGTVHEVHVIPLAELADPKRRKLLKWAFSEPERLRPGQTTQQITETAAGRLADLAQQLRGRGYDPQAVAHFLNRLLFCLFAEDAGLLPTQLVTRLFESGIKTPERVNARLANLFQAMAKGGDFGVETIDWFNGGLFDTAEVLPLEPDEIKALAELARLDWSAIEPSIFGTLFERGLDPAKRSQLGAHYTDPATIQRLLDPVLIDPLRAEWAQAKAMIAADRTKTRKKALAAYQGFLARINAVRVLDPACGSGNFLYLALKALKDLEHQAILEAEALDLPRNFPQVGPEAVRGIELNPYAAELARLTVWIGELQWTLAHGWGFRRDPILRPLETIEQRDALISPLPAGEGPGVREAEWPPADVIVGNPPFLGGSKKRGELGEATFNALAQVYAGRVPAGADLVTYWFEKARAQIEQGKAQRAGLVATNSIRGGANRKVLERILSSPRPLGEGPGVREQRIFAAWSDEPWINEGAAVRVSLVCFGSAPILGAAGGTPALSKLNGQPVAEIYADLTAGQAQAGDDLTTARPLAENGGMCFQGPEKNGPFDVTGNQARQWLKFPNPNGRPNSDVLKPRWNGLDLAKRYSDGWVIDFGTDRSEEAASLYEAPFTHVVKYVRPQREKNRDRNRRLYWWRFGRIGEDIRAALAGLPRYIATPEVAKHRVFIWMHPAILPDKKLIVIARSDDVTFGVLHSRFHELWSLGMCSWHGKGNDPRYTPTTTFDTFPFPDGLTPRDTAPLSPTPPPVGEGQGVREAIAQTARRLNELRENWLNPPEWVERVPEVVPGYPDRILPKPGHEKDLKARTLTNLYNQRPAWLVNAHRALDEAVAAAYGWPVDLPDQDVLARLLRLNSARSKMA